MHQAAWYEDNIIPYDWLIGVSENGWTTNEIGLTWLNLFYKYIKDYTVSTHQLLVLDGHGSHVNPKFNQFCLDYKIIVIYIPAHLSYLLQPLNIGCFSALKQAYRYGVKQIIASGVNYINKHEFLPLYIQAGFIATSLILYNPNRVLVQLYTKYQILPPRLLLNASQAAETLYNIAKLQQ